MGASLTHLSNRRLLSRLNDLVAREREITLRVLDHLSEVERRDLFLGEGFSSMFSYCTRQLGYSESAANRRIRTARCLRRFPPVRELLAHNLVNISTVSMVAGLLTNDNCAGLLAQIEERSQTEVRAIIAEYQPRKSVRDEIRPVVVVPAAAPAPATGERRTLDMRVPPQRR